MNDWTEILSLGIKLAPAIGTILLASGVVWIVWRTFRKIFQALRGSAGATPSLPVEPRPHERREPTLEPVSAPSASLLDSSEILALKASIDALTSEVAALSKKLSSTTEDRPVFNGYSLAAMNKKGISIEPLVSPKAARTDQSLVLTEKTS